MKRVLSDRYFLGRKCMFCDSNRLYRLADGRVKCKSCGRYYSLQKLRNDLMVLYYFHLEISANKVADELEIDYETVQSRFMKFREQIAKHCEKEAKEKINGELEIDESYFGGKRKGKRGRGSKNKAIVFGILERKGKVYTAIVPDVSAETLMAEIEKKTIKGSVFYSDGWKSYVDLQQYGKHNVIDHDENYVEGSTHINGIEGFWSYAKERFRKYHGIRKDNYPLYLKEMEFRFNNRNRNLFKLLVDICVRRTV